MKFKKQVYNRKLIDDVVEMNNDYSDYIYNLTIIPESNI